jgi:23S rRNA (adenine2503-C2)-methyltransferase
LRAEIDKPSRFNFPAFEAMLTMSDMPATVELPLELAPPATPSQRAVLDATAELSEWFAQHRQPAFRLKQIRRQIIAQRAESFADMTELPSGLRAVLASVYSPLGSRIERHLRSNDGTQKLVLGLHDGRLVESVLIPQDDRRTACISTQVGCGMGCVFCASGIDGVARNLSSGEILEQLIRLRNLLPPNERLTHVVVMGMGEPLANLDALIGALEIVCDPAGLNVGQRHITISTVGLPHRIRRLADMDKQYHLAVSLHAPNDNLRNQIVPTNSHMGLDAILAAADYFYERTGRQVTYEYILLGGLNDGPVESRQLAELLRSRQAHVNLIPFNDVSGLPYRRPTEAAQAAFVARLRQAGISVKVRRRRGADIDAACGQLRRTMVSERTAKSDGET